MASQQSVWGKLGAAFKAFREALLSSDETHSADFESFEMRRLRYAVLWSYYESTTYRVFLNAWATKYMQDFGLYKYARNIFNPSYRLAEFWVSALVGGLLDEGAGDTGALPIQIPETASETDAANLRAAIAQIWRDSNFQVNKAIFTRNGIVKGDTALRVVDDVQRGKVYLEVVRPDILKSVTRDPSGNVKAYEIEELRANPEDPNKPDVTYTEIAERLQMPVLADGTTIETPGGPGSVRYQTFLNGKPYAWNGIAAEWTENYGFVPLVVVKHIDVGLDWGWAEILPGLSKLREADDQWSVIDDHIRVKHKAPWLFNFSKPTSTPTSTTANPTSETPQPGREDINALYIKQDSAKGQALVADLQIEHALANLDKIISQLEKDYPEIRDELFKVGGADASGRALRILREPVELKATERRAVYDNAIVRAHQMAISIGAQKGYAGFEAFSAESFNAGALNHNIAQRPVFRVDPLEKIEQETAFWKAAQEAEKAHVAVEVWLELQGWDADKIGKVTANPEFQARRKLLTAAADEASMMQAPPNGNGNGNRQLQNGGG